MLDLGTWIEDGHCRFGRIIDTVFKADRRRDEIAVWDRFWADQISAANDENYYFEHDHVGKQWLYEQVCASIRACAGDRLAGKTVAEIGCGSGYATLRLAEYGARPVLIDASANALVYARLLAKHIGVEKKAVFEKADLFDSLANRDYDIVFNSGVLEHYDCDDAERMLANMRAAARPGGVILVVLPNLLAPTLLSRMIRSGTKGSERFYSPWLLKRLFRKVGLTAVSSGRVNAFLPVETRIAFMKYFDRNVARFFPAALSTLFYCYAVKPGSE